MINFDNKKVLVVAAHPDDEVLGCGGTLFKLKSLNCKIHVVFLTDGVSSRTSNQNNYKIKKRKTSADTSAAFIGINKLYYLNFPDNELDKIPLLDVIKKIKKIIQLFEPNHIFTHSEYDLNIDHQIAFRAVLTATRPEDINLTSLICFEIPSSTDYSFNYMFKPNLFIDISKYYEKKMKCLEYYFQEMRSFPHPRSFENIKNLNKIRGSLVGHESSEAFEIKKLII